MSRGGMAATNRYYQQRNKGPRGSSFAQHYLRGVTGKVSDASSRNKNHWKRRLKDMGLKITTFGKKGVDLFQRAAWAPDQKSHVKLVKYLRDKNPGFKKQLKKSQKYNTAGLNRGL
mgnify:CR=1 FL=1